MLSFICLLLFGLYHASTPWFPFPQQESSCASLWTCNYTAGTTRFTALQIQTLPLLQQGHWKSSGRHVAKKPNDFSDFSASLLWSLFQGLYWVSVFIFSGLGVWNEILKLMDLCISPRFHWQLISIKNTPLKASYLNTDLATGLLQSVFRNLGLGLWKLKKDPVLLRSTGNEGELAGKGASLKQKLWRS